MVRLPPHVTQEQFLEDAERLTVALDATKAQVKKYGHFEAFFAVHWDWATSLDTLQVVFERWRRSPAMQVEARNAFFKGQVWNGSYFCTQGPTQLNVEVTDVTYDDVGQALVTAELSFQLKTKKSKSGEESVQGAYVVTGRIEAEGRGLSLEPVPGSWKTKPKNFVMVGLQGVVSRSAQGSLRYAGSIPIYGCDSFELQSQKQEVPASEAAAQSKTKPKASEAPADVTARRKRALWNSALARLGMLLATAQQRWRLELAAIISEKGSGKEGANSVQVQKLLEAARTAGLVSFELTTPDGEQITVKVNR